MNCQNCGTEIPANWVDAINNLHLLGAQISFVLKCTECNESVMDDNALQLLSGLNSLTAEQANAQDIMSWILSNYKIEKTKEGEKGGFRTKMTMTASGAMYADDKQQKLAEFLQRADVSPALVGKSKKDLLNANVNAPVTLEEDDNGLLDVGDEHKDPAMANVDIDKYHDPTMMELPDDQNMPPALRALLEKNLDRQNRSLDNVTSGIRINKNAFSRG